MNKKILIITCAMVALVSTQLPSFSQTRVIPVQWTEITLDDQADLLTLNLPRPADQRWIVSVLASKDGKSTAKIAEARGVPLRQIRSISRLSDVSTVPQWRFTVDRSGLTVRKDEADAGSSILLVTVRVIFPKTIWIKTPDQDSLKVPASGPISFRNYSKYSPTLGSEQEVIIAASGIQTQVGHNDLLRERMVAYKEVPVITNSSGSPRSILCRLSLGSDGVPTEVKCPINGDPAVLEAVSQTIKSWRFRPISNSGTEVLPLPILHTADGHLATQFTPAAP